MKINAFLLVIILLLIALLAGCGEGGEGSDSETVVIIQTESIAIPESTSIVMYCDSMGLPYQSGLSWLEMLGDLAQVDVVSYCKGGIQIREYPLEEMIAELGTDHKYAIVALGVNDNQLNMIETLNIYEDYLNRIDKTDMEAVCFLYPVTAQRVLKVFELNEGIISLCQGRKIIISGTQIADYIHFTDEGRMQTAENAWRTLF